MTARKPWFLRLARPYVRRRLARELDGVFVHGLAEAAACAARQPVIFAVNHVAWWDAFLLVALDEAMRTEGYALMDAGNLRRLPFFGWAGAVPLDPARPRRGLRAAAALLDRPGRALWIFPQGGQRPAHLRPLAFQAGVGLLARQVPQAVVMPVALQYVFREAPRPAAYAYLGNPLPAATVAEPGGVKRLEQVVAAGLEAIDAAFQPANLFAIHHPQSAFTSLVPSRHRRTEPGIGARLLGAAATQRDAEDG